MIKRLRIACGTIIGLLSTSIIASYHALANPEGGTVVEGSATFTYDGPKLDIHQSTDRAVIDWRSFDIAPHEHTEFIQPSSSSVALNRVNSMHPSQIDGRLTANGHIIIINPNGVFFGQGSRVDVGGLTATTANINNHNFMAGNMDFMLPGNMDSAIVNEGTITTRQEGGKIILVAPRVENKGTIEAKLGKVVLASGEIFTLDLAGDGLLQLAVTKDQLPEQVVANSGKISASGGEVLMTTASAQNIIDSLIVNTGVIEANAQKGIAGKITLYAEGNHAVKNTMLASKDTKEGSSRVINSGTIEAKGINEGEQGGEIALLGDDILLQSTSNIDASGNNGGGTIYVGGELQGGGTTPTALKNTVEVGAFTTADSLGNGDGGKIIFWSDGDTSFQGHAQAKGGIAGGNGGFIEISGAEHLNFQGTADTSSPLGLAGTLLLDPTNITISSAANSSITGTTTIQPSANNATSNLSVSTLTTALASNNVIVQTRSGGQQAGDLTVQNAISWSSNQTLTLDAHNNITINAPITARNTLTLSAGADLVLNADLIEQTGGAALVIQPKTTNNTIGVAGGTGTLNLSTTDLSHIQSGWDSLTIGATTGSGAMTVNAYTWNIPVVLRSGSGVITVAGAQTMGTNNLTIQTNANLALNAALTGSGNLVIRPTSTTTSIGLAGGAGTLALTTSEISQIANGWERITIGRTDLNANITVNTSTWNDRLTLLTAANIVLGGTLTSTESAGDNFILASTAGNFINNAGSSAINPGPGRFLVYSTNPSSDTLGGLTSGFRRFSCTYGGSCPSIPGTGNGLLYTFTPSLTTTATDPVLAYGDTIPGSFAYTLSGYLGSDSSADTISGSANFNTTFLSTQNAGTAYSITNNASTLASSIGYSISYATANGTVSKRILNAVVDGASRVYGDANPTYTASNVAFSNFVNSETASVLDTLSFGFSGANATSNAGTTHAVTMALSDGNYQLNSSYTQGLLTITKRTLGAIIDDYTRVYGDANPIFNSNNVAFTNFANSEDSSVLDNLVFSFSGSNATTNADTTHAITLALTDTNYQLNSSYTQGLLTINKRILDAVVDDASRLYGDANPAYTASNVTFSNFANSETAAILDILSFGFSGANTTSNAGTTHAITMALIDGNYRLNPAYTQGILTINPRPLTITAVSNFNIPSSAISLPSIIPLPTLVSDINTFINSSYSVPSFSTPAVSIRQSNPVSIREQKSFIPSAKTIKQKTRSSIIRESEEKSLNLEEDIISKEEDSTKKKTRATEQR